MLDYCEGGVGESLTVHEDGNLQFEAVEAALLVWEDKVVGDDERAVTLLLLDNIVGEVVECLDCVECDCQSGSEEGGENDIREVFGLISKEFKEGGGHLLDLGGEDVQLGDALGRAVLEDEPHGALCVLQSLVLRVKVKLDNLKDGRGDKVAPLLLVDLFLGNVELASTVSFIVVTSFVIKRKIERWKGLRAKEGIHDGDLLLAGVAIWVRKRLPPRNLLLLGCNVSGEETKVGEHFLIAWVEVEGVLLLLVVGSRK